MTSGNGIVESSGSRPAPGRRSPLRGPVRILLLALAAGVALLAAAALGVWLLVSTTGGSRWLLERLAARSPVEIEASLASGNLLGSFTLTDVRYAGEPTPEGTLTVAIERIEIDWQPRALLEGRLILRRVAAEGVTVELPPSDEPIELIPITLPIVVEVPALDVSDLAVLSNGDPLVRVDRLALAASAFGRQVGVEQLSIDSDLGVISAVGQLTTIGNYPLSFEIDWSSAIFPDLPLSGHGHLGGDLENLSIEQQLDSPVAVAVSGAVVSPFYRPQFELAMECVDLDLREIEADWPPVVLTGAVDLLGTPDSYRLSGDIVIQGDPLPDGSWQFDGAGDLSSFELASLVVRLSSGEVRAAGSIAWRPEIVWALEVVADDANPALLLPEWPGRIDFEGSTSGSWSESGAEFDATVTRFAGDLRGQPIRGGLEARVTPDRIDVTQLTVFSGGAHFEVAGRIDGELDLTLRIDAADLESVHPDLRGSLSAAGALRGTREAPHFILQVEGSDLGHQTSELVRVDGEVDLVWLDGAPIAVHLRAAGLSHESLAAASLELEASGSRDDLRIFARGDGLRFADVDLERLELEASGSPEDLRISARGDRLGFNDLSVERLELEGSGSLDDLRILASGNHLTLDDRTVGRLEVEVEGSWEDHRLRAETTADEGGMSLRARGGMTGERGDELRALGWEGEIETADFDFGELGAWGLDRPVELQAGAETWRLSRACWRRDGAGMTCLQGEWAAAEGWRTEGALEEFPLGLLASVLPGETVLEGSLEADFLATGDARGQIEASLTGASRGTVTFNRGEVKGRGRTFEARISEGRIDAAGARLSGEIQLPASRLTLDFELPGYHSLEMPLGPQELRGTVEGNMADISPLEPFILGVRHLQGSVHADTTIAGTVDDPRVEGEIVLQAAMDLPGAGISLDRVAVTAAGGGQETLRLDGEIESDGKILHLSGTSPLPPTAREPAVIRLDGNDFKITNTPEARIWASPSLQMTVHPGSVKLGGEITIPRADFEFSEAGRDAIPVSADVVIVGGAETESTAGPQVVADLRLNLGEAVSISGPGFAARLGGGVRVVDDGSRSPIGHGQIKISRGTYRGYGQDLRIDEGKVSFAASPIDDPALDIPAYRRARDGVIAGILIRGTLQRPEASLYSVPSLPDSEILAYILTGSGRRPGNQDQADSAAASLGLAQSTEVLNRMGLRNVSLRTDGTLDEAQIVLGRYLSPGLYVSYGIGVFEQLNTLRISYELSEHWSIEADNSAKESGADLLYTFEK